MMPSPRLTFDLDRIEHNARTITGLCGDHGIRVTGVTKCVCGHPAVARAMLRGGVADIGDSRLENIRRMREAGIESPFVLVRLPPLSGAEQVVECTDASLNSEPALLRRLSVAADDRGQVHEVMLMVDLGDLREGLWPSDLPSVVAEAAQLPGIRVRGLGVNLACFAGVVPTEKHMNRLVSLAEEIEESLGIELAYISGLNSSGLELLEAGSVHPRVNHARIGEAILLGRETTQRRPWPGTHQDAFTLHAEVLELKTKPSQPVGERGEDAFGGTPRFEERGDILHALLNVGREDVDVAGITPLVPGVRILGASSGYLILDVSALAGKLRIGGELTFALNYSALLRAMTSEYVKKQPVRNGVPVNSRGV
ncbi:MAG: alanine/ornithine racemase family PLP-dependent enzyme [Haliea sp.]|jgi:predicted amino acid racemase|nr:alanine/ornithine racemase family PLP-dependent enzyme [Haliea sp.]